MNLVDALAGGDILKWETVMKMQYNSVKAKLLLFKTDSEYQRKLHEIHIRKNTKPGRR